VQDPNDEEPQYLHFDITYPPLFGCLLPNEQAHLPQGNQTVQQAPETQKGQQAISPRPLRSMCSAWCTPGTGVNLWGESPLYVNPLLSR
jgi:hypothetical protein